LGVGAADVQRCLLAGVRARLDAIPFTMAVAVADAASPDVSQTGSRLEGTGVSQNSIVFAAGHVTTEQFSMQMKARTARRSRTF
jgi:hypothetical protein